MAELLITIIFCCQPNNDIIRPSSNQVTPVPDLIRFRKPSTNPLKGLTCWFWGWVS